MRHAGAGHPIKGGTRLTLRRFTATIGLLENGMRFERSSLVLVAHEGKLRGFESCGERGCIGMFGQSAGKPEMMSNAVYACHTIANTDTLTRDCRIIRRHFSERIGNDNL